MEIVPPGAVADHAGLKRRHAVQTHLVVFHPGAVGDVADIEAALGAVFRLHGILVVVTGGLDIALREGRARKAQRCESDDCCHETFFLCPLIYVFPFHRYCLVLMISKNEGTAWNSRNEQGECFEYPNPLSGCNPCAGRKPNDAGKNQIKTIAPAVCGRLLSTSFPINNF